MLLTAIRFLVCLLLGFGQLAFAKTDGCGARLVSFSQARRWLRSLDIGNGEYDESPEYEFLLQQTQIKLNSFGMNSRRLRRKMEDQTRQIIEITSIAPYRTNINGRIIQRARERFGLRVFVDPVMARIGEGRGSTDAPEKPTVYLDFWEIQRHFRTPNLILLHEIRHIYLSSETTAGRVHRYQGEIMAEGEFRFERPGFYEDEFSFEELSNYARDVRVNLRRFISGELNRTEWKRDLNHLLRVATLVSKNLRLVRPDTPDDLLFTDKGESFKGVVLVWPVVTGDFENDDPLFLLQLEFPGVPLRTRAANLRDAGWTRIQSLIAEADRLFDFARDNLKVLE